VQHTETTGDYWRLLEITVDYWRLLEITGDYWLKHCSECTMGHIAQGCGQEANIARGETECYICPETMPTCNVSHSARA